MLGGIVLDDDAAVHHDGVIFVNIFGVVGMQRVGIVAREHEAVGHGAVIVLVRKAEALAHAVQHIVEERTRCALFGPAADLFIVEDAADLCAPALVRREERGQRAEGALQIVQPRGGDELVPFHALLGVVEIQVGRDKVLHRRAGECGDARTEAARAALSAIERDEIDRGVIVGVLVDAAVHVDGNVRHDRHGLAEVHQTGLHAVRRLHQHAPGDGQRPVQPGGIDHPAVALRAQADKVVICELSVFLDLKAGAVAVRGGDHKAVHAALRHAEGNDGRAVARDKIAPAGLQRPGFAFA